MSTIVEEVRSGRKRIGIIGCGFIGYSSAVHYAKNGCGIVVVDTDPERVKLFNDGHSTVPNLDYWIGFDPKPLVERGLMVATTEYDILLDNPDVPVIDIAVPTEKDGHPWNGALINVFTRLSSVKWSFKPLFLIESTMIPTVLENEIIPLLDREMGKGTYYLAHLPRRDWFGSSEDNVANFVRVVGGIDDESTELAAQIAGIVSKDVVKASTIKTAILTKICENSARDILINFYQQLSVAYGDDVDVRELAGLVATKYRHWAGDKVLNLYPSCGVHGYCISMGSVYAIQGSAVPQALTLPLAAHETNENRATVVARAISNRGLKSVLIKGMAYKGDIPVAVLSPATALTRPLKQLGIEVFVQDPYFTDAQIAETTGAIAGAPESVDSIMLIADHRVWATMSEVELRKELKGVKFVLDNTTAWGKFRKMFADCGIEYKHIGQAGWLGRHLLPPSGKV